MKKLLVIAKLWLAIKEHEAKAELLRAKTALESAEKYASETLKKKL